jgi:outer membrane protein TolC
MFDLLKAEAQKIEKFIKEKEAELANLRKSLRVANSAIKQLAPAPETAPEATPEAEPETAKDEA